MSDTGPRRVPSSNETPLAFHRLHVRSSRRPPSLLVAFPRYWLRGPRLGHLHFGRSRPPTSILQVKRLAPRPVYPSDSQHRPLSSPHPFQSAHAPSASDYQFHRPPLHPAAPATPEHSLLAHNSRKPQSPVLRRTFSGRE